jgi:aryl-alcohol dehydrogenase-like predicted oxidoreductase
MTFMLICQQALPLLKAAWEKGVTTWDTANMYSQGESERIIGKAIKQVNILFRNRHDCH